MFECAHGNSRSLGLECIVNFLADLVSLMNPEPSRHIHSCQHIHLCRQSAATLTAYMHSPEGQ